MVGVPTTGGGKAGAAEAFGVGRVSGCGSRVGRAESLGSLEVLAAGCSTDEAGVAVGELITTWLGSM
jgi:hypothetical protein